MASIHRIVLTGGPCGGKTTAMARISERFESLGYRVYRVPEAATLLIAGGLSFKNISSDHMIQLQTALIKLQMTLEDSLLTTAQLTGRPAVILCDRGLMDSAAFLSPGNWQAILDENDWTTVGLRDRRYDAVVHLMTAAKGAETFYTLANNVARSESPEQARALDSRLLDVWVGHPHLRIIDNSTDFNTKVLRVIEAICRVVGVPKPVEIERKFLVKSLDQIPVHYEEISIEQSYLLTTDQTGARIRKRGQMGAFTYFHTVKRPLTAGQRIEEERQITPREYATLLAQADPARHPIKKTRTCFMWNNQYFELDRFLSPHEGLILLEAELDDIAQKVELPPFIKIDREVTEDPSYSNHALAAK